MNRSIWKTKSTNEEFPNLTENIETDIAIIGGGITGITTAHLLTLRGKKVVVVEALGIGEGTTGDSTGNLYAVTDKRMHHIQSSFHQSTLRQVIEARMEAIDLIENLVNQFAIDCNFQRVPWYLFSEKENDELVEKEKQSAIDAGLKVSEMNTLPFSYPVRSAIRIDNQAQFNPAAYVKGLAGAIKERCSIYANTAVSNIDIFKGEGFVLTTPYAKIKATKIILATHIPKGVLGVQTSLGPYREYALAVKLNSGGTYPEGIFWSTDPEHHISVRSYQSEDQTFFIVVGEDHKVGQAEDHKIYYERLENFVRSKFDVASVEFRWSAQHYKPADGLPYIGETIDEGIFMATGFSTDGLVYGTLSGMILTDLLTTGENSWAGIFDSKRFTPIASAKKIIKENINVLGEYIKDYLGTPIKLLSQIQPGMGKVVEYDKEKLAVYRDDDGGLHAVSAICPHLKCVVNWNNAEKTWDCPCHGSRFTCQGEVIEGPAYLPLARKDIKRG